MINLTYFIRQHFELKLAVIMWWIIFPIFGWFLFWLTHDWTIITIYLLLQIVVYSRLFWTELNVLFWFQYADIVCSPQGFIGSLYEDPETQKLAEALEEIGRWKDIVFIKYV